MIRIPRALGLALMASLAMAAVVASAAQAAPEFHLETALSTMPAEIKGNQIGVVEFRTVNGTFKCNIAEFNGTSTVTATTTLTLSPTLDSCLVFGFKGPVSPNGCTYTFNLIKSSSPAKANTNINCPAGKAIVFEAPAVGCTTTVGAQTGKSHVIFSNTGNSPTDLDANVTVSGKTYTASGSGCLFTGTFNDGTTNGEFTFRAYTDGVQQALSVS